MRSRKPTQTRPALRNWGDSNLGDFGLACIAGLLAALAFPNFNYYLFIFIFPIPLLLALENAKGRKAYFLGVTAGFSEVFLGFYWIGNWANIALEWPEPINHIATLGYSFFMAQCFGLVAWLYTFVKPRFKALQPILFPLIWCNLFSLFPFLFPFHLGDSQTANLVMLQPIEWTGVWGFDFIALLTASGITGLILNKKKGAIQGTIILGVLLLWATLGFFRLQHWDREITTWPQKTIGLVQTNRPASIHKVLPEPGYSRAFPLEMDMTRQLVAQGAEVVFWPEGSFYGYAYWVDVKQSFNAQMALLKTPLIFLDSGFENRPEGRAHFNTTFLISERGIQQDHYHKRHLVPFGEYTPFLSDYKWAKQILGSFLATLQPGETDRTFDTAGLKIVPKICFEILFPKEVSEAIGVNGEGKVLLVQSQDGWYGESSGVEQHLGASVLRAIENRVPLIHVINNGPSSVILPSGKYAFKAPSFEKGAFAVSFPYSTNTGGSFYSNHPGWMINVIHLCGFLILGLCFLPKKHE